MAVVLLLCGNSATAQTFTTDSSKLITVNVTHADRLVKDTTVGARNAQKLIGNVALEQAGTLMFCDSAYLDVDSNNVQAFGNVHIQQPGGTDIKSDYLRYTGNNKLAFLSGNVVLTDGKNTLWSEALNYNTATKVGTYDNGGTLQAENTTLSSNIGMYNAKSKDSRFTGEVFVNDPGYTTTSRDLGYNTISKLVTFYDTSTVVNDKSTLHTSQGTYDSKNEIGHFTSRTSFLNKDQYIEGDTLDYNRHTGYGNAKGHVIALDTTQHTTLYSGFAAYNEKSLILKAYIKPVLKKVNGQDSIFIRADTFYSAPANKLKLLTKTIRPADTTAKAADSSVLIRNTTIAVTAAPHDTTGTIKRDTTVTVIKRDTTLKAPTPLSDTLTAKLPAKVAATATDSTTTKPTGEKEAKTRKGKKDKKATAALAKEDTLTGDSDIPADSTAPRYFIGYYHVLVFSDSLQGRCDSISYSQQDSIMRMMYNPISWTRNSQVTGDTILLYTDSSEIKKMYVPNNALVVSQSGPEKAKLFDQIQGKTLTGYLVHNEMDHMIVFPNAESIYYPTDEKNRYIGVSQSTSDRMRILFNGQKITRIIFEQEVKDTMTPIPKADLPNMKLSRFQWLKEKRPKSKEELFK